MRKKEYNSTEIWNSENIICSKTRTLQSRILKQNKNWDITFQKSPTVKDKVTICQVYLYYKKNSVEAD